jgi:SAM-dependent methyltransferase
LNSEACICPKCGQRWPVKGGIPRFFQEDHYWGEIGRRQAQELLEAARQGRWAEAVRARFRDDDDTKAGFLSLQRASWAPMLGLDERSVALDIGCGHGAITQSLSRSAGEVYAIEAVPERLEFTQERLRQEGIGNVRLIQASATALPLLDNSFDVVVTNGVLEWVGEWDTRGNARDVQLRFLRTIRGLLKDDGVLVIGIENRFGYSTFLGSRDHSGIPYTSLVPRPIASLMLRHTSGSHYRTALNAKREYRTYTYSERGYRKLLAEAGFAEVSCRWADPGYNQPCNLIPTDVAGWVEEHWTYLLDHPGRAPSRTWRRRLKRAFARTPLLTFVLPEFLLIAAKRPGRETPLSAWLRERLADPPAANGSTAAPQQVVWALYTHPFARRSVVRLRDRETARELGFAKIETGDSDENSRLEKEFDLSKKLAALLPGKARSASVPDPLGSMRLGSTVYVLESAAHGEKFSQIVRRPDYFEDEQRVRKDFGLALRGLVELSQTLQVLRDAQPADPRWYRIPKELEDSPEMIERLKARRYFSPGNPELQAAWVQHGDLSVENVFLDRRSERIEVIDWTDLAGGLPPLYDLFTLLYSGAYVPPEAGTRGYGSEEERWIASFNATFFEASAFGRIARDLTIEACRRLEVPAELIGNLLVEYVLIRAQYYLARGSSAQGRIHLEVLRRCLEPDVKPVFGDCPPVAALIQS